MKRRIGNHVISGKITVLWGGQKADLHQNGLCMVPDHDARTVANDPHLPATHLVVICKIEEPA